MARREWPIALALTVFATAALLVIADGVRPIVDDWIYIEAGRHLAATGQVEISILSVPNAVFEALFGGSVVVIGGDSFATFSIASATLGGLSGVAFYDLVRRTGVEPLGAGIATLAYLFTPLYFAINTTFMTDGHAVSLVVIAAALLARGMDGSRPRPWLLFAGSLVACLGYLSRPASLLIIGGAAAIALLQKQWRLLIILVGAPLAVAIAHFTFQLQDGIPAARQLVLESAGLPSLDSLTSLTHNLIIQIGLWTLPFVIAIIAAQKRGLNRLRAALVAMGVLGLVLITPTTFGDWVNPTGMFPLDVSTFGQRPEIISQGVLVFVLSLLYLSAALGVAYVVGSKSPLASPSAELGLWLVGVASLLITSFTLAATNGNFLDRYALPLFPAFLYSLGSRVLLSPKRWVSGATLVTLLGVAVLTLALTIDGHRTQKSVFEMSERALDAGVSETQLDGGAAWTGLHLADRINRQAITLPSGSTWWRDTFANDLDPSHVVSLEVRPEGCLLGSDRVTRLLGPPVDVWLTGPTESC